MATSKRTRSVGAALAKPRPQAAAPTPVTTPQPTPTPAMDARPANTWDGLQNVAAGLGTVRDKRTFSFYAPVTQLTPQQLSAMYRGSWLAGRIIDTVAGDMTREWVSLSWDGYDRDEGGAEAIESAEEEFDVPGKVQEGVTWGRLQGGGAILVGLRGEDLAKPLNLNTVRKGSLQYLYVLDRTTIFPSGEMDRALGPHLGQPLYYMLGDTMQGAPRVHWSRVIIFRGRKVPRLDWQNNGFWDDSELQHVVESTQDYDATRAGIASMVWEANVDVLKLGGLATILSQPDGEAKVQQRLLTAATIKSFNRMFVIDKDKDDYGQKTVAFGGVKDVIDRFMIDVCGAADIPMTRLFGQSAAGLTSTGEHDLKNYYDHVKAKQRSHLRPQLKRLYDVLVRSTLGRMPEKFAIRMNPLWQTSDKENAEIEKLRAERDKIYYDMGAITGGLAARELHDVGTYRSMEDEDVELAEEMSEPVDVPEPEDAPEADVPGEEDDAAEDPNAKDPARAGDAVERIRRDAGGWRVYSASGKRMGGPYKTKKQAKKRLARLESYKST